VPSRLNFATADVPQSNILLLEEYAALGAAIRSALKKFAPQHHCAAAGSLAQTETLALDLEPELFIIDVDPPWTGLTNFLEKMRAAHPNARALVIGASIPAEIAAVRGSYGALQFIEKSFDLAAFGAAIQALLGPWVEREPRGTLGGLNTIDILLSHYAANANLIVDLHSGTRTGEIQINGGQVLHAATGPLKGENALRELLSWSKPRISEKKLSGSSHRTITNWQAIVLEALREIGRAVSETRRPEPEIVSQRAGKKIVVVDDTEMLLIFVEDILATADPELQITTALSATEGLQQIERVVPDLVLLDYSLPDFNGDELCERLLQTERTAQVPVLMMSGHVQEMNAAAARLPNVVAKIEKPFLSNALVDLVRRTLDAERSFRERVRKRPAASLSFEPERPRPQKAVLLVQVQIRSQMERRCEQWAILIELERLECLIDMLEVDVERAKPINLLS